MNARSLNPVVPKLGLLAAVVGVAAVLVKLFPDDVSEAINVVVFAGLPLGVVYLLCCDALSRTAGTYRRSLRRCQVAGVIFAGLFVLISYLFLVVW